MIGEMISHYQILEELGRGGMGVVYKAEDTKLKRTVALKFLPPELTKDPDAKKRFIHEAQAASALDHANICTIYEVDETEDGRVFIAMACYGGKTIKEKITKGPLPIPESIDMAIQIAQGLQEAHDKKIVHRDIKSANVLLTDKGQVKIMDFGLAKLTGQTVLTKEGSTLGTVAYMSPEQAQGRKVDARSDIWSLGVVLYEMLTGKHPFIGDYDQAVIYSILNEEPEPVTGLRTGVPIELEGIVKKAMAKNPDERYQHVEDLIVDMKKVKMGTESTLTSPRLERKRKPEEKVPLKKILLPVGVVLILLLGFLILRSFISEEVLGSAPIPVAVIPFENRTGDNQYDNLNIMIQDLLITKLSDSKYMYVSTRERLRDILNQMNIKEEDISSDSWFDVCHFDGIEAVVIGSVNKAGDTFVTDVKVLEVESKELIESASARGKGVASILDSQIDELGKRISRIVGLSNRKIEEYQKSIREVTTTSIDAYNYFLRGREELEKHRVEEARKFLEMAIALDSTFSMAYLWLGLTNFYLRNTDAMINAYEKGKMYSLNATEKERMYIESSYARDVEGNPMKSIRILKQMAKKYPKEKRVYYNLAGCYTGDKFHKKRIELYEKALELDPNYGTAMNGLAYAYSKIRRFEEAIKYLKMYASISPGDPNPIDSMAEIYYLIGKLDEAIEKYKEVVIIEPEWLGGRNITYIYGLKENYIDAMKSIDQYISNNRTVERISEGHLIKGFFYYLLGRIDDSIDEFEYAKELCEQIGNKDYLVLAEWSLSWIYAEKEAFDLSRKNIKNTYDVWTEIYPRFSNLYKACCCIDLSHIYLMEGKIDSAKSKVTAAKLILPKVEIYNGLVHSRYDILKSKVLTANNDIKGALSIIQKTNLHPVPNLGGIWEILYFNLPFTKDALGQVYQQDGKLDNAIAEYERITRFDSNSNDRLLIHPEYHYRLAKLYQEKGLKSKAIERYQYFLQIWMDADDDIPEKMDAEMRLASLKGD